MLSDSAQNCKGIALLRDSYRIGKVGPEGGRAGVGTENEGGTDYLSDSARNRKGIASGFETYPIGNGWARR